MMPNETTKRRRATGTVFIEIVIDALLEAGAINRREAHYLTRRYVDKMTLEESAAEKTITRERVRQILARAERRTSYFIRFASAFNRTERIMKWAPRVIDGKTAENLGAVNVQDFPWSVRTRNAFRRAGVSNLGDLVTKRPHDLLKLRNFGQVSLKEVETVLASMGLELAKP